MITSCISAPESNQKQVANILTGNTESGNLTERDKAILAQFEDWWVNIGKAKYMQDDTVDIYADGVFENHPEKSHIIEDFKNRDMSSVNPDFISRKTSEIRNVILDFPTAAKRKEVYETVAYYINDTVASYLKDASSGTQKPTLETLKDKVRELIANDNSAIMNLLSRNLKPEKKKQLSNLLEQRNLLLKNLDGVYPAAIAIYKMYYADITQAARINDSNVTIDDEENNDEQKEGNFEDFSPKDSYEDTFGKLGIESFANSLVKQIMTQMVSMDENGKQIRNSFNVPEKIPSARVFGQLATWLSNIETQEQMLRILENKSKSPDGYWLKGLFGLLNSSSNAEDIKNALFVTFNKANVNYAIHTKLPNGRILLKNFLKTDSETVLSEAWKFQIMEILGFDEANMPKKKDTIYIKNKKDAFHNLKEAQLKLSELLKDYSKPVKERESEYVAALRDMFETIGISLSDDVLETIVEYIPTSEDYTIGKNEDDNRKKLLNSINSIFSRLKKYVLENNLNSTKEIEYSDVRQYIEELSREIGRKMLIEVQRSTKIGKDIMYNTVNNSFILTQKKLLFGDNYYEGWIKPYYLNDPWYNRAKVSVSEPSEFDSYLPILNDINFGKGDEYVRVLDKKNQNDKEYTRMNREDLLIAEWSSFLTEYSADKENNLTNFWGYFRDGIFGDGSKLMFVRMPVYPKKRVGNRKGVIDYLVDIVDQEYRRILRTEAKIAARKQGKQVRITDAETKSGLRFNFFPELNASGFYKTDIERFAGLSPKGERNQKINFKEALDILSKNPTVMHDFIEHYLYNTDKGIEEGIIPDIVKSDKRILLNSKNDELSVKSAQIISYYNEKYGKSLFGNIEYNDLLSVKELKQIKKKASEKVNELKEKIKNGTFEKNADIQVRQLESIINAATTDIDRNIYDNIDRFLYNRILHSIQLLELRDKDLAYFKNFNDYIKRSKQSAGDYVSPNVDAPTHNKKTTEKILVVKDPVYSTDKNTLDTIISIIDKAVADKKMTFQTAKYLKEAWSKPITATDGQMLRTIVSKRDLDIMLAFPESTGINDKIYETLIKGKNPSEEEFNNVFRIIGLMKEFSYSMPLGNRMAPTQLKNGTMVMNTSSKNGGIFSRNNKLKALQKFAEDNNYDAIVFASGMKVGTPVEEDMIDLDIIDTEGNSILEQAKRKPLATVDEIEFKFLGEQTKEKNFDMENASMNIGTQLTKIVPSILKNISGELKIGNQPLTGKQAFTLYQTATVLEKLSDWDRVKKAFSSKKDLNSKLKGGIESSKKFLSELTEGLETDENGNPLIPYNDITVRGAFEDKLLAFGRKTMSKLLASSLGDHLYTASDYGFEGKDKLNMEFDSNGNLKYVECYVPLIYKDLLEDCLVTDNGGKTFSLDKSKIYSKYSGDANKALRKRIEELFNIIGYRVPTEGMCSIIPLKIKGFLPLTNQGNIILPAEMITRTGHDMDGDEIFILKRASRHYTKESFLRDNNLLDKNENFQESAWNLSKEGYQNTPVNVRYTITDTLKKALETGDYDTIYKEMSSMSDAQLHNMLVDLIYATATSEEGTLEGIRISSFEDISRTSKLIKYMDLVPVNSKNVSSEIEKVLGILNKNSSALGKEVDSLMDKAVNPMSLKASLDATEEALAGKKFLGIFAVGKAVGAITLTTDTSVKNGPFINGKQLANLSMPVHSNRESVSSNIAQAVAACPDNSKDPTITSFGVNDVTKNVIQLLIQGGFDLQTIGLLMNQPVVKKISSDILKASDNENPAPAAVTSALEKFRKYISEKIGKEIKLTKELEKNIIDGKNLDTSVKTLVSNILKNKAGVLSNADKLSQYYIGVLFNNLYKLASIYSNRSRCLRGDSNSGSLGTSIEESLKRVQTVKEYKNSTDSKDFPIVENFPIVNADYTPSKYDKDSDIFKNIMMSSFPLSYAQYALGLKGYLGLMSDFYPEINPAWEKTIFKTKNFKRTNFRINDLYTFLWHKDLQKDPSQNKGNLIVNTIIKMPVELQKLKNNPQYKDNAFIKDLGFKYRTIGDTDVQIPVIESYTTMSSGRIKNNRLQDVIDGWKQLNEDSDASVRAFSKNMFMYFLYVYGNTWKAGSLAFSRPNSIVLGMPNYRNSLEKISVAPSEEMSENYNRQSILNHLNLYAISAPQELLDSKKINQETMTVSEIKDKLSNPVPRGSGFVVIQIQGVDGTVYLADLNDSGAYTIVEPKSVNLDGLTIINMDSSVTADSLPDIQGELIKRASETHTITKEGQQAINDYIAAQEADIHALEQEDPTENYFTSISDEELAESETVRNNSYPVSNLEDNKDESGNIVDSEGNVKC